jgi:hypothetical protein
MNTDHPTAIRSQGYHRFIVVIRLPRLSVILQAGTHFGECRSTRKDSEGYYPIPIKQ